MTREQRIAERVIRTRFVQDQGNKNVIGSAVGLKRKNGKLTSERCVKVFVKKKLPLTEIPIQHQIPRNIDGIPTDVVQADFEILTLKKIKSKFSGEGGFALDLTAKRRPCEAGFSIGHTKITAGTLGLWGAVQGQIMALSNAHVFAPHWDGVNLKDFIIQPGKHDEGKFPGDQLLQLEEYVRIEFQGQQGPPKKKNNSIVRGFWKVSAAVPNAIARLFGCNYRLSLSRSSIREIEQNENYVDAAIGRPIQEQDAAFTVWNMGTVSGISDLVLGDIVAKTGRTTETTNPTFKIEQGMVTAVGGEVQVSYGGGKVAVFKDQVFIEREDGKEFSAGGDSGSAILVRRGEDIHIGGLLFAGGDGLTIANRISHIQRLLGFSLFENKAV